MGRRLAEVMRAASDLHLVTDGKSIYLEDNQDRIIDIFKNSRQPMFLVCVSDQVRRLDHSERKPVRMEPGILARRMRNVGLAIAVLPSRAAYLNSEGPFNLPGREPGAFFSTRTIGV